MSRVTPEQHNQIELRTRGQSSNKVWRHERTKRLDPSNLVRICTATEKADLDILAQSVTQTDGIHSPVLPQTTERNMK